MASITERLDHPLIFLFIITIGVIGMTAVMSWGFASLGWTGPLGLLKGGTSPTAGVS